MKKIFQKIIYCFFKNKQSSENQSLASEKIQNEPSNSTLNSNKKATTKNAITKNAITQNTVEQSVNKISVNAQRTVQSTKNINTKSSSSLLKQQMMRIPDRKIQRANQLINRNKQIKILTKQPINSNKNIEAVTSQIKQVQNYWLTYEKQISPNDFKRSLSYFEKPKFPFTKQDSKILFKIKDADQKYYDQNQIIQIIGKALQDMNDFGFDLKQQIKIFEPQINGKRNYKRLNRKIYLKFECPSCYNKIWTSILGNFQISFEMHQRSQRHQRSRHQQNVKWMLKLYSQQCKKCDNWGTPYLFESQLRACAIQFCLTVANIYNNQPKPENVGDRFKGKNSHFHREDLCQACKQQVCFNIPKQQETQIRKEQY